MYNLRSYGVRFGSGSGMNLSVRASADGAVRRQIDPACWIYRAISRSKHFSTTGVNKGCVSRYPVRGMVRTKDYLMIIGKSSPRNLWQRVYKLWSTDWNEKLLIRSTMRYRSDDNSHHEQTIYSGPNWLGSGQFQVKYRVSI